MVCSEKVMISLAITTYNRSQYFWDSIKSAICHPFIGEIVVSDDFSSDYTNLYHLCSQLDNDKIKIYRNEKNEGAFINKYNCVSKCSFDWVYLFDSDNWFDEHVIDIISKLDFSKNDTCYAEEKTYATDGNIVEFDYQSKIIDLDTAKEYIKNSVNNFSWFLNNGNFLVNKTTYLDSQKIFFDQELYHGTIDVFLFSYYWFMANNKYEIVKGLYHHHRIHNNSYFMKNYDENMQLVQKYFDMILEL